MIKLILAVSFLATIGCKSTPKTSDLESRRRYTSELKWVNSDKENNFQIQSYYRNDDVFDCKLYTSSGAEIKVTINEGNNLPGRERRGEGFSEDGFYPITGLNGNTYQQAYKLICNSKWGLDTGYIKLTEVDEKSNIQSRVESQTAILARNVIGNWEIESPYKETNLKNCSILDANGNELVKLEGVLIGYGDESIRNPADKMTSEDLNEVATKAAFLRCYTDELPGVSETQNLDFVLNAYTPDRVSGAISEYGNTPRSCYAVQKLKIKGNTFLCFKIEGLTKSSENVDLEVFSDWHNNDNFDSLLERCKNLEKSSLDKQRLNLVRSSDSYARFEGTKYWYVKYNFKVGNVELQTSHNRNDTVIGIGGTPSATVATNSRCF